MIDHVDVDLRSALGSIRDQGPRPTCLAHAVSAAHEHARDATIPLSPEYLHFFAAGGHPSSGVSMNEAAKTLKNKGQPEEAHCPYRPAEPPAGWSPPKGLHVFRRASERKSADATQIEQSIRAGRVPVLGISLPQSFFTPRVPWVISSVGAVRGLHAVAGVGVGRHQRSRVVLVRNSWGPDWGDGGYAWLDDRFIAQHLKGVLVITHEAAS